MFESSILVCCISSQIQGPFEARLGFDRPFFRRVLSFLKGFLNEKDRESREEA